MSEINKDNPSRPVSVLVIDNYDSFVYNLVHYLEEFQCEVSVRRNDELELEEVAHYDKILLSPGPGIPEEAGLLKQIIREYSGKKSILGVCLGQQAIGEVFGGKIINLQEVYHGISSLITRSVDDEPLFEGLDREIEVGRYHSWVVDADLPACLEATSFDQNGQVMSLRHKAFDIRAVQFHPESVLTPQGKEMIANWIRSCPESQETSPKKAQEQPVVQETKTVNK